MAQTWKYKPFAKNYSGPVEGIKSNGEGWGVIHKARDGKTACGRNLFMEATLKRLSTNWAKVDSELTCKKCISAKEPVKKTGKKREKVDVLEAVAEMEHEQAEA